MSVVGIAIGGVLGVLGAVILGFSGRELLFAVRVYRGEPDMVADIVNDPGPVELQGIVEEADGTVRSPFTDSECVVCEWAVETEHYTDDMGGTTWEPTVEGLRGGPFRLADDTASCRVEPSGSDRRLEDQAVTVPAGTELPDRLATFVADRPELSPRRVGTGGPTFGEKHRFVERRLDIGEDCYVYGQAHYDATAGGGAGSVNAVVNGDGARRFLIADTRSRDVVWSVAKAGLGSAVVAVTILFCAALAVTIL